MGSDLHHVTMDCKRKCWVGIQWDQSYLMRRRCLLASVDHPSSDGVLIKMPYAVDVLHLPALHPIFLYWVG